MKRHHAVTMVSFILLSAVACIYIFMTARNNDGKDLSAGENDVPVVHSNTGAGSASHVLDENKGKDVPGTSDSKVAGKYEEADAVVETGRVVSRGRVLVEEYRANPSIMEKIEKGERLDDSDLHDASVELRRLDSHIQKAVRNGAHVSDKTKKYYLGLQKAYMEAMLAKAPSSVGGEATAERLRRYLQERAKLLRSMDGSDLEIHAKERALKRKILSGNGL